jgi:quercetin dioxygenase-like cupin family protein
MSEAVLWDVTEQGLEHANHGRLLIVPCGPVRSPGKCWQCLRSLMKRGKMTGSDDTRGFHVPPGVGEALWSVGDTFTLKATAATTGGALTFFEVTVPPQTGTPPHIHRHEDEALYVLEGELTVRQGDRTFVGGPGTFAFLPRGELHGYQNAGSETAKLVAMAAPAGIEGFFREAGWPARQGEPAPSPGPEEMRKAAAAGPKYGIEVPPPDAGATVDPSTR